MRVRITCGNVPGALPYSWQKLAECELDCSGTIDARFCAWRTPGGVKSVNLCELSVPGTEARCHRDEGGARANHGSARCSRAGATAGGRREVRCTRVDEVMYGTKKQISEHALRRPRFGW